LLALTRSRFVVASALLVSLGLIGLGTAPLNAQASNGKGRTVWDGSYTDAQAARATATFSQSCANCHTLGPEGKGPLTGDAFWKGFTQKTVADLLTFVKTNMPNGSMPDRFPRRLITISSRSS